MRIIILLVIFKSVFIISSKADDWNYSLDSLELFQVKSDDLMLIIDSSPRTDAQRQIETELRPRGPTRELLNHGHTGLSRHKRLLGEIGEDSLREQGTALHRLRRPGETG